MKGNKSIQNYCSKWKENEQSKYGELINNIHHKKKEICRKYNIAQTFNKYIKFLIRNFFLIKFTLLLISAVLFSFSIHKYMYVYSTHLLTVIPISK